MIWERTELKQLNFHPLPSPSLYAKADEVHRQSIYSDDPYDPPTSKFFKGLRRRSSVLAQSLSLGISIVEEEIRPPLSKFQWPSSPIAEAAFEKAGVVKVETKEGLRSYVAPSILGMLRHDVFGEGCLTMTIPAILFAVQNNLMSVQPFPIQSPFSRLISFPLQLRRGSQSLRPRLPDHFPGQGSLLHFDSPLDR